MLPWTNMLFVSLAMVWNPFHFDMCEACKVWKGDFMKNMLSIREIFKSNSNSSISGGNEGVFDSASVGLISDTAFDTFSEDLSNLSTFTTLREEIFSCVDDQINECSVFSNPISMLPEHLHSTLLSHAKTT